MVYLRNCWYMAAWSHEVAENPLGRVLLDEPIVLYRTEDGVKALKNRCPHRFVALSMGQIVNGNLECPYHGLQFDGSGQCVHNPQGDVPSIPPIKSYPIVVRHQMIWIWMGDVDLADPSLIPDFSANDEEHSFFAGSNFVLECNYHFAVDNLLDLTHIDFLHKNMLAKLFSKPSREAGSTELRGETIWSLRRYYDVRPQFPQDLWPVKDESALFDRWQDVRWDAPSNLLLVSGIVPAGTSDLSIESIAKLQAQIRHAHVLTPETAKTTHYFYSSAHPRSSGVRAEERVSREVAGTGAVFRDEDAPMLATQQKAFGDADFWQSRPLILAADAAAIRVRRAMAKRMRQEHDIAQGGVAA